MLLVPVSELRSEAASSVPQTCSALEVGWQRQGKLWSNLRDLCDLLQLPIACPLTGEEVTFQHVQVKAGQRIYRVGQPFDSLYIVYSGFLKTVLIDEVGNEQVLSFPMKGDLIGADGIYTKSYTSESIALSNCDLILLPFKKLSSLARMHAELEQALLSMMSRELIRKQALVSMIGALSAEARVARFLISLSNRFAELGYSNKIFNLRMTRQEIGSYLGLTLETVSRTLSAFNTMGFIRVHQRSICIEDRDALDALRRLPTSKHKNKKPIKKNPEPD